MQTLDLCLGDADLSVLCLPSLQSLLKQLRLNLKGMQYAFGLAPLGLLTSLHCFYCESRSEDLREEVRTTTWVYSSLYGMAQGSFKVLAGEWGLHTSGYDTISSMR